MAAPPTVSVVVTCYNLGRYLDEAIDSVLAQTFQDFEIVVVDDGSTEPDTVRLLETYQRPRTRVVRIENRGLPGARNEGIRRTTGAYLCMLDADDLLVPTFLEKSVAYLDAHPDTAFVSHWLRTFGEEEQEWTPSRADFPSLLDMNSINGAALVRREALEAVGRYDESMRDGCEDWDLWIGMVERGLTGHILPEVLFLYRRRSDSMSREMMKGRAHVELYRQLVQKHRRSFEAHGVDLLVRREADRAATLAEAHDLLIDCRSLDAEVAHLRDSLRIAESSLSEHAEREQAAGQQAALARRVESLEAEAAQRQAALAGRIESLEAEAAQRQVEIGSLRRDLSDAAAHSSALTAEIDASRAHVSSLEKELGEKSTYLNTLSEQVGVLEAERLRERDGIAGLQFEIRMLRSSWSWRLTRPLRAVYSRLFER